MIYLVYNTGKISELNKNITWIEILEKISNQVMCGEYTDTFYPKAIFKDGKLYEKDLLGLAHQYHSEMAKAQNKVKDKYKVSPWS